MNQGKKEYNKSSAIISIFSGAGGRDAEDWVVLLSKMYQKYSQNKGWPCQILSQRFAEGGGPQGRIGLKEITLLINGPSYHILKKESGVHRLVRLSPFSAKQLRHTSFARVEVLPKIQQTDMMIKVKPDDLRIETFRSSGHGGQNVNKRETAIRITHLPTNISVSVQTERHQAANRKIAEDVLMSKLQMLEIAKQEKEISDIKGERVSAEFGRQIRSYVLHPYKQVKDLETGIKTGNAEAVLNGDLDKFYAKISKRHKDL